MTKTFNVYEIYKADHSKFGGVIYFPDFNTEFRGKENKNGSPIASRIASDQLFDKRCKKNREDKERSKQFL